MQEPPEGMLKVIKVIDTFSEWSGKAFAWMIVPLVLALTYEVVARYGFDAPTIWAYDVSYMGYGGHFMLGAGYTLLQKGHIRPDFFYEAWPGRRLALLADARGLRGQRVAAGALSLQVRHARHGGAAPHPGHVRIHQERLGGEDGAVAVSPELLGLVLLFALIGCIFIGFPIAFTLIILGLVFGYIGFGGIVFNLMVFQTLGMMKEETLAAVPLFIFMGHILEQAGLMERLFKSFQFILAPVRGSLYLGVLLTATIFATATGIIGASVTVMGLMAAPVMIKAGYDPKLTAGAIAAGGTLGILIPPSVMLVVMGPVLGVSVIQLFAAAIIPGVMLSGLYIGYAMRSEE